MLMQSGAMRKLGAVLCHGRHENGKERQKDSRERGGEREESTEIYIIFFRLKMKSDNDE